MHAQLRDFSRQKRLSRKRHRNFHGSHTSLVRKSGYFAKPTKQVMSDCPGTPPADPCPFTLPLSSLSLLQLNWLPVVYHKLRPEITGMRHWQTCRVMPQTDGQFWVANANNLKSGIRVHGCDGLPGESRLLYEMLAIPVNKGFCPRDDSGCFCFCPKACSNSSCKAAQLFDPARATCLRPPSAQMERVSHLRKCLKKCCKLGTCTP